MTKNTDSTNFLETCFLSSSKVFLFLAFYHFLSTKSTAIQYYYDDTSFYSAIWTVTEKDLPSNVYNCPLSCGAILFLLHFQNTSSLSRLQYYTNSTSSFQRIHLFIYVSLNPGPLTRSQSVRSKDVLDQLYPTLHGELSSSKGLKICHLNINGRLGKIHEVKVLLRT